MSQTFVVVGAGLAAAKAVEELRTSGFEGEVVVFGTEHHLPYERPPLSKGYLLGNDELETAFVHDPDWYDEFDVDLRLGQEVTGLDTAAHVVRTRDGQQSYDRLLIATGASPGTSRWPTSPVPRSPTSARSRTASGSSRRSSPAPTWW